MLASWNAPPVGYRHDLADYYEAYAATLGEHIHFRSRVTSARALEGGGWEVRVARPGSAAERVYRASALVVATGEAGSPHMPHLPGTDGYKGHLLHSAAWRGAEASRGKRALVVGLAILRTVA